MDNDVDMSMPGPGAPGDFNDEGTTVDVGLPVVSSAQEFEGANEVGNHFRQVLPVANSEGEVFQVTSGYERHLGDESGETLPNASEAWAATDRTEPIATVDRNVESVTAVGT